MAKLLGSLAGPARMALGALLATATLAALPTAPGAQERVNANLRWLDSLSRVDGAVALRMGRRYQVRVTLDTPRDIIDEIERISPIFLRYSPSTPGGYHPPVTERRLELPGNQTGVDLFIDLTRAGLGGAYAYFCEHNRGSLNFEASLRKRDGEIISIGQAFDSVVLDCQAPVLTGAFVEADFDRGRDYQTAANHFAMAGLGLTDADANHPAAADGTPYCLFTRSPKLIVNATDSLPMTATARPAGGGFALSRTSIDSGPAGDLSAEVPMTRNNPAPVRNASIEVAVTDAAGQEARKTVTFSLSGQDPLQVVTHAAAAVERNRALGEAIAFGGTLQTADCGLGLLMARGGAMVQWEIREMSGNAGGGTVVERGRIALEGRRTPYLVRYTPREPGTYGFFLVAPNQGSPVWLNYPNLSGYRVQVLHQLGAEAARQARQGGFVPGARNLTPAQQRDARRQIGEAGRNLTGTAATGASGPIEIKGRMGTPPYQVPVGKDMVFGGSFETTDPQVLTGGAVVEIPWHVIGGRSGRTLAQGKVAIKGRRTPFAIKVKPSEPGRLSLNFSIPARPSGDAFELQMSGKNFTEAVQPVKGYAIDPKQPPVIVFKPAPGPRTTPLGGKIVLGGTFETSDQRVIGSRSPAALRWRLVEVASGRSYHEGRVTMNSRRQPLLTNVPANKAGTFRLEVFVNNTPAGGHIDLRPQGRMPSTEVIARLKQGVSPKDAQKQRAPAGLPQQQFRIQ